MANLDSLTLDIKADASNATSAIDSLITKLGELSDAMGGLANAEKLGGLAQGVSALSGAMGQLSGVRKDTFVKLSESLKTINETPTTNLENVASGVSSIAYALDQMQGLNTTGVENIARSIKYLGSTTGEGGIQNLKQLGNDLNQFANDLMFIPDTTQSVARITSVVDEIRRLGTKTGNTASTNFASISSGLVKFINDMNGLNLTFDSTKLTSLISAISRLGYASSTQAVANLPNLTRELKNLFDTLARTPAISNNLVAMTQALANLTANLGGVRQVSTSSSKSLDLFSHSAKKARTHTFNLASAIGKLYATYFLLFRLLGAVGKSISKAMNVNEVQNYMGNAMKQVARTMVKEQGKAGTDSAEAYLEAYQQELVNKQRVITDAMSGYQYDASSNMLMRTNTKNLGMNPNELIQYQAQFSQMADSMGATTENAMKLSEAYAKLGADLASVKDVNYADAWNDMSSGMVGMSKVMDKYGINIRVSALNQRLMDMGIDTTVNKLNAEQKALLRTIVVLDSSRYAWTDLSRTLDQPANEMRLLRNNVSALGMSIGSILLSGIARVLPYINALVIALQRLAQYIIKLFGITLPATSSTGVGGFGDLADSIYDTEDAMDDASKSAKKLKNNLLGIDELNIINDNQGSSTSGAPSYNGDELQAEFDKLYEEYMKAWDEAYNNMDDQIQRMADTIVNAFKNGDYESIGESISDGIKKALQSIKWNEVFAFAEKSGAFTADFLNGLLDPDTFYEIGKFLANSINTVFHNLIGFIREFDWINAGLTLASLVNGFADTLDVELLAETISDGIIGALRMVSTFFDETDFEKIGEDIGTFLKNIKWGEVLKEVGRAFWVGLGSAIDLLKGVFDANPIAGIIVTAIATKITISKVTPIITAIGTALSGGATSSAITSAGTAIAGGVSTGATGASAQALLTGAGSSLGGYIIAGVTAAIAGFSLGEWIYLQWGGDESDLLSKNWGTVFDYFSNILDHSADDQKYQAEQIAEAVDKYNENLYEISQKIGFETFEAISWGSSKASEEGKRVLDDIEYALGYIGHYNIKMNDTKSIADALTGALSQISGQAKDYVIALSQQYDSLDANNKATLEQAYGIRMLADDYASLMGNNGMPDYVAHILRSSEYQNQFSDSTQKASTTLSEQDKQIKYLLDTYSNYDNAVAEYNRLLEKQVKNNGFLNDSDREKFRLLEQGLPLLKERSGLLENNTTSTNLFNNQQERFNNLMSGSANAMQEQNKASSTFVDMFDDVIKVVEESTSSIQTEYNEFEKMDSILGGVNDRMTGTMYAMSNTSLQMSLATDLANKFADATEDASNRTSIFASITDKIRGGFSGFHSGLLESVANFTKVSTETDKASTSLNSMEIKSGILTRIMTANMQKITESIGKVADTTETDFTNVLNWFDEMFKPQFTLDTWMEILSGVTGAFEATFTNVATTVISIVNRMIDAINASVSEVHWDAIEVNGEEIVKGGSAKLFEIPRIQGFEMGGYPDKGSIFMANENGAEMIGNIGNRTAVVNNDQIVQAVSQGVESAVAGVMLPYLSQIANNTERTANKNMSVNIGDREIARANMRGQRAMGRTILSTT